MDNDLRARSEARQLSIAKAVFHLRAIYQLTKILGVCSYIRADLPERLTALDFMAVFI